MMPQLMIPVLMNQRQVSEPEWDYSEVSGLWLAADPANWTANAPDHPTDPNELLTAPDGSAAGNDLTVLGAITRNPADSSFNDQPTVASDGSTGYLQRAAFVGGALAQPYTVYVVLGLTASTTAHYVVSSGSAADYPIRKSGTNNWRTSVGGTQVIGASYTPSQRGIVRQVINGATTQSRWTPHGAAEIEVTGLTTGTGALAGITLLAASNGGTIFPGTFALGLVYSGIPDTDDDAYLMAGMLARFGVTPL